MIGACPSDPDDIRCCIKKSCDNGAGTCLDKNVVGCANGQFETNLCPGPSNIQCCVKDIGVSCKNTKGQTGLCQNKDTTACDGGTYQAGFCPGPTNVQCCIKNDCPEYWVIGVRGSLEPEASGTNSDINAMGVVIGTIIGNYAAGILPTGTEYYGLPYPAEIVPVTDYFSSEQQGWQELYPIIKARVQACPNIKIGVAGYSQGAQVVNDALHFLESDDPGVFNNIRAVLQVADPKTDPSQTEYFQLIDQITGLPAGKTTKTGILGSQALPDQLKGRATSICYVGDIVCNAAPDLIGLIIEGVDAQIHLQYLNCCTGSKFPLLLPNVLGASFANRMKGI